MFAQTLPEPRRQFGASVTGAFEGWYEDGSGARGFLVGYYNRNTQEELDIPIGPNNRIEPGGPDLGQPTHFLPTRRFGMFAIPVPKGFTPDDKLTWTIVANGKSTSIPLRLNPDYLISPFSEIAVNNTPPTLKFEENGTPLQGPDRNDDERFGPHRIVVRTAFFNGLGYGRYEIYKRYECTDGNSSACRYLSVVEISWAWNGDIRQACDCRRKIGVGRQSGL